MKPNNVHKFNVTLYWHKRLKTRPESWLTTAHRQHLLGELDFYREQQYIGVGFFKDNSTPHVEYWTVYLTKASSDAEVPAFEYIPHKGFFIREPDIAAQEFDDSTTH